MTPDGPQHGDNHCERVPRTSKTCLMALVALGFSSVLQVLSAGHANAESCAKDVPIPEQRGSTRVVQLVNCSNQTLLGTANAAHRANFPETPVLPREGTWVMEPVGTGRNFLTIDIPPEWLSTGPEKSIGPIFWARTGCRYDVVADRAQCESGGSGGKFDVSKALLGPPAGATITEWNMAQEMNKQGGGTFLQDNFDISAVNGVNLTVDIEAVGDSAMDPGGGAVLFWLRQNSPLSVHGADLRADCLPAFTLKRSDLTGIPKPPWNQTLFASVIVGDDGQPLGGDGAVTCFNNCGKYKFPAEEHADCNLSDPRCLGWQVFCAGNGTRYNMPGPPTCTFDPECQTMPNGGGVFASCWNQHLQSRPADSIDHTCQLRGFLSGHNHTTCTGDCPAGPAPNCDCSSPCPPEVCPFQYGFLNPITGQRDFSTQPPFGGCAEVFPNDTDRHCIGEDRIHAVLTRAYTWPNDPQVYASDAPLYRVVFSPGGTSVPITPSVGALPFCTTLPAIYKPAATRVFCSTELSRGAVLAIAHPTADWGCNLLDGAGDEGVICRWNAGQPAILRDFDHTHKADILWRHVNGSLFLWFMNGTVIGSSAPLDHQVDNSWVVGAIGDFDNDGRADIFWRHTNASRDNFDASAVWLMNGTMRIGEGFLTSPNADWVVQGTSDVNGDNQADIIWRDASGTVYIWLMNGTMKLGEGSPGSASYDWVLQGFGDFNHDGKADVLWRHSTLGTVLIWFLDGTIKVREELLGDVAADWAIQGVADVNADGNADIIWRNAAGTVAIWLMDGTTRIGEGFPGSPSHDWVIQGVGDVDGDLKADIVWRHQIQARGDGPVYVWLLDGVSIKAEGTANNVNAEWAIQVLGP
jgi:FG-GAP-like repeat